MGTFAAKEWINSNLYNEICTLENIGFAFKKARKGKTLKPYVIEFECNLEENLQKLHYELITQIYNPKPLETFIIRDPKTRKISKSDFRDRIVHHALCNVIEPLFEKSFIFDSFANRKFKGTLKWIERFEQFSKRLSHNFSRDCYVLKADIKHYFDTIDNNILLTIIKKKIDDERVINLIKIILENYSTNGKGMPLGNLTSQFFANVYLNELDQFVKHKLKAKYYIRYVDDFIILDSSINILSNHKRNIDDFLKNILHLTLHPDKSRILKLKNGVGFLGMRLYPFHKRIIKKNINRFDRKLSILKGDYQSGKIEREKVVEHFEGWLAYISYANTFKYRNHLIRNFNQLFPLTAEKPNNISKHLNFIKKVEYSSMIFSVQKTLSLWKRGRSIQQIAKERGVKESTIWSHFANLIEFNQLSVWKLLGKEKTETILCKINSETDKLKDIKARIKTSVTYDEIACCLSYVKSKSRTKNILYHVHFYQKVYCFRKCYFNKNQRKACSLKFDQLITSNPLLQLKRQDFLDLFNNHINICVLPEKEKLNYMSWAQFQNMRRKYRG